MLQVRNISKWFGDVRVLNQINFTLNRGDRAGLIGPNGSGKSTLLKIITGDLAADQGHIVLAPASLRWGYLPQAFDFPAGASVGDVLTAAQGERVAAETHLALMAERLAAATGDDLDPALAAYDRALAAFDAQGGGKLRADASAVLAGLGMAAVGQDRPVAALSGGQKTRLGLARLLLAEPDLLLLDEPTNHLDITALAWLEDYLAAYPGAILTVSHDRAFLDRTVNRILALDETAHTLRDYPGNYTDYARAIDRDLDRQWAAYFEQKERIQQLNSSIRKLTGKSDAIEAESLHFYYRRIAKDLARRAVVQKRRLERMLESEDLIDKPGQTWKMKIEFPELPRAGQDVLHIEGLAVGYDGRKLLDGVNLHLRHGERAVLIGPNGSGKTTLLRCITGELAPWVGEVRLGRGVRLGYMAQEQETLPAASTPLDLIRDAASLSETEARSLLSLYLFKGDEVFTAVGQLSLGERSRLALALMSVRGCNFLLLDEPINHLDIPARERFEQAMTQFEGTVLAVVHDRYFIERIATTLWALEEGTVRVVG
ncbi:MAG: ATP-binding cassette domain-containing protein [Caldilineales bacterium]|nr:ATP-binding cassette domain-containing protein [Caldilineales bacterium]MCW5857870.1 ABC-F family ATP-binding cassette domain-containing protein [Caldilineales bacterium]